MLTVRNRGCLSAALKVIGLFQMTLMRFHMLQHNDKLSRKKKYFEQIVPLRSSNSRVLM